MMFLPLKLLLLAAENVKEEADKELYDIGVIQKNLLLLELKFERNELSEEEYRSQYEEWLRRYECVKEMERREWDRLLDDGPV
ncbi:gas vesicle protein GvpG [Bacillus mangrovi]|uniref:Gas vesicle protein GvpG n=1 Tax=Metabacillus mangrovi TaxID=1491830 RepID=A0A7X2S8E1_9BACI|nr:gas vesicle protein GvpG [Metabacillus mangrovi]MTH55385.1 gas vesicle protein GvpG [Metabacillus mangrovi]